MKTVAKYSVTKQGWLGNALLIDLHKDKNYNFDCATGIPLQKVICLAAEFMYKNNVQTMSIDEYTIKEVEIF